LHGESLNAKNFIANGKMEMRYEKAILRLLRKILEEMIFYEEVKLKKNGKRGTKTIKNLNFR